MITAPEDLNRWVTVNEAAQIARVSRRTIFNWVQHGKLQTRRTVARTLRIWAASLFIADEAA